MTFGDVFHYLYMGMRVRRDAWRPETFLVVSDGTEKPVVRWMRGDSSGLWAPASEDLMSPDWSVVTEDRTFHNAGPEVSNGA